LGFLALSPRPGLWDARRKRATYVKLPEIQPLTGADLFAVSTGTPPLPCAKLFYSITTNQGGPQSPLFNPVNQPLCVGNLPPIAWGLFGITGAGGPQRPAARTAAADDERWAMPPTQHVLAAPPVTNQIPNKLSATPAEVGFQAPGESRARRWREARQVFGGFHLPILAAANSRLGFLEPRKITGFNLLR